MKILRSVLSVLALCFVATAAHAQQTAVSASIPFNFIVGDRAYPAGEYVLQSNGPVLRITDADKMLLDTVLSNSCEQVSPSNDTKLVFHRMGGDYFLEQIWVAGRTTGRELPRSKSETRLAKNHVPADSVIVAANVATR